MNKVCCYECAKALPDVGTFPVTAITFIVCLECGNKRCPKATNHDNACTGSNESGQEGSRYQ